MTAPAALRFMPTRFEGAWVVEPEPHFDQRGAFARTWCAREFAERGLATEIAQASVSLNRKAGSLRGIHFQRPPHEEAKVVRCTRGALFDIIVDLRPSSSKFGVWQGFELTHDNRRQIYIPRGFAHGFQTLEDDTEVDYLISAFFAPEAAAGLRWNDPHLAIEWPLPVSFISEKDRQWPDWENAIA
jgi:dTDP-4-dehydrorhamnose 3,5-epimerase